MRSIQCELLQYLVLQRQWRPPVLLNRPLKAYKCPRNRQSFFSSCIVLQQTRFVESFFSARSPHNAPASEALEESEYEILARARAYNIHTSAQLSFESEVVHNAKRRTRVSGVRLVDRPPYKEDFYLWTILLDWRKLKYGDKGIRLIWEGLKSRCWGVDLPFVGYQGDRLWSAFVSTGTRNHKFLEEIIRYELKKGCQRPDFFAEVVGALLRSKSPSSAKSFARMLQSAHRPNGDELFDLFVLASTAENPNSLQIFCDVYAAMPSARLYGRVIAYLCAQERISDAWTMHRFLLSLEDLPQSFEDLRPLVMDLVNSDMRLESLLHELSKAGISMEAQARSFYSQERSLRIGFASENLNIVSSSTLGIRPRALSDDFVARAFSTSAFSFDAILGGLRFFGLKTVGPSSIRAIGLTATNSQDLMARFSKLAENDVDTGSTRFSRLVKELARQGQDTILQDVLHSDQHADVFEDLRLQRRLLLKYYQDKDLPGVNRTLAILTMASDSKIAGEKSANLLLRAALSARNWTHVQSIMDEMVIENHRFDETSIARMYSTVLSRREPSSQPTVRRDFDDLGFLISIWLKVLRAGSRIPPARWREPIRRLGMCGRLDELESLLVRLLHWYGKEFDTQAAKDGRCRTGEVEQLLSTGLQSAIVAWGFIHTRHLRPVISHGLPFGEPKKHPWVRGVLFLRSLKDKHHCDIDVNVVRKETVLRLRQLFHLRTESVLLRNRRSQSRNRLPLWLYVEAVETAWKEPLFLDKVWLLRVITAEAPLWSRHKRRVNLRRQLGRHVPRLNAQPEATNSVVQEYGQNKGRENVSSDIVIHGGPLSQSYWSIRE